MEKTDSMRAYDQGFDAGFEKGKYLIIAKGIGGLAKILRKHNVSEPLMTDFLDFMLELQTSNEK